MTVAGIFVVSVQLRFLTLARAPFSDSFFPLVRLDVEASWGLGERLQKGVRVMVYESFFFPSFLSVGGFIFIFGVAPDDVVL